MTQGTHMDEAIRRWAQRHSGRWRETDEVELQAWLAVSPEHRAAYEKVAGIWAIAGELRMPPLLEPRRTTPNEAGAPSRSAVGRVALAACIAVLTIAVTIPFWNTARHWWNGAETHLATLKGQPRPFVLDDGTRVLLDADSELIAHIGARQRRIELLRGEARFEVLHDPSRQLEISAGSGRIADIGTHFDVEMLTGSTRVSVLEGEVSVSTNRGRTLLVAGQAGGFDGTGNLAPVSALDEATTYWAQGQRHFDRERLADVLERLARYHAVSFTFADQGLRDLRVSGTFKTGDLDLFLRTLAAALPIESRYLTQGQIQIASRSPHQR